MFIILSYKYAFSRPFFILLLYRVSSLNIICFILFIAPTTYKNYYK